MRRHSRRRCTDHTKINKSWTSSTDRRRHTAKRNLERPVRPSRFLYFGTLLKSYQKHPTSSNSQNSTKNPFLVDFPESYSSDFGVETEIEYRKPTLSERRSLSVWIAESVRRSELLEGFPFGTFVTAVAVCDIKKPLLMRGCLLPGTLSLE